MNIIQYQYPFDPNGVLPSNLITNENHNITASAGLPYNFIIPRKGPYFADSLVVTHPASGRTLDVGVDYVHSYLFQQQSNTEPFLMIYGGISLLTTEYDGAVLSLQYQTLGGEYVLPETDILAILANAHIDPRLTTWDSVAFRPGEYHPEAHLHHVSTTMGWDELVLAVRDLIEKIRVESSELAALFQAHIDDKTNPHETDLIKLGIDRFANVYKATLSQANLGTNDINYITPFLLRDVLNNTDLITADRVGLGLVENFPPATSTEILLGTIGRYVTSDLLKEFYARRNGEGATGLWDISILGNSATTSRLLTTRRINGTDFNGTANITTNEWGTTRNVSVGLTTRAVNGASNVSWSLADIGALPLTGGTTTGFVNLAGSAGVPLNVSFLFNSQNTGLGWGIQETSSDGYLRFQTREGVGSWTDRLVLTSNAVTSTNPITAPNFIGALTGNASTATALQTARLINGTSFNGTADITTANWGTARTLTVGNTGKSVNGGGNVSWSLAEIGAPSVTGVGATGTWAINITGNAASATNVNAFVIPESGRSAGVSWTGLSDHHHIYAERYATTESTRLVIENTDNDDDYTVFRHVSGSAVDTFEVRRTVVRSNVFFEHVGMNRISDGTLKLNQSEVNYDDFDIDQLSLMNWTWADDERVPAELRGKPGQGVIAQEVMKVFPDCVRESDEGILRVDDAMLATKLSIILLKKLKKLGL